ncbi:MAG: ABC transporter ATP-binding protein [Ktedonobacteraceae bacterium]|nr:ABC transporter ATP-binding protein [Ktedonobacteraceae bacterium]
MAPPQTFYKNRAILEACGASAGELTRISWHTGYTYQSRPPLTLDEGESAFAQAAQSISASYLPECDRPSVCMREPVVQAEQLCYRYEDGTVALKGISAKLYRGEMLALLGPNGSGKTTFAKVIAGIYRPSDGNAEVLGQDLRLKRVRSQITRSVGYVFQNPDHQLFCRKVSDEVEYGLKNLGLPSKARQRLVQQTLEAVDLIDCANEDPLFLSKGQRQRLAVAAVLAMGPDILIVDEPTTGQDYRSITAIMRLLCTLQQQGKTILVITHDMTLVVEYCQRVIAFCDGLLAFSGTPQELFGNQEMLQRTGLHSPTAAALTTRIRTQREDFPSLLTVEQWSKALGANVI